MAGEFKQFLGLLLLGNIENLILASQGVVLHLDPLVVGILSLIFVVMWLAVGTFGTKAALKHANLITFVGGLAIFLLGLQSMLSAVGLI
ncbi:MAG: hypothetical protein Q4P18_03900 [Methanobrevibacter sp.]|uniref:hypothetical protein n=1 Tax=Methanobrevibacter sp. TaxID=66852 RepID=UPI0026DF8870|nr:hypothetical protein [Methanobrevibacter sp.]MDO5848653.1 hypothetical protein [Methanobrevibacter sp.]